MRCSIAVFPLFLLLTALLLSGCGAPSAAAAGHDAAVDVAPPTPTLWALNLPATIPASGVIHLTLPTRGTPESDATMTVAAVIYDAVTKRPVPASVYVLADQSVREPLPSELLAENVVAFELTLPSVLEGRLLVRADGYRDWDLRLSYRVKTSRVMEGPVELERVRSEGI